MKILIIMLLLTGCISANTKVGDLLIYKNDPQSRDKNSELIGEVYLKNKKFIFVAVKNDMVITNELTKRKIEIIQSAFDEINKYGYLEMDAPGKPEYYDGGTKVNKNQVSLFIYADDKNFWSGFSSYLEMLYGYRVEIKPDKNQPIQK